MVETENQHTRDIPQPMIQLPGLTRFRFPVYDEHGSFSQNRFTEVTYPIEAVSPSLRFVLDWYVAVGKVTPADMQKMVNNGGTVNTRLTEFLTNLNPYRLQSFDDYRQLQTNRGSLSSLTHDLVFPDRSVVAAGDIMAELDADQSQKVTQSYLRQYNLARHSILNLAISLYSRWLKKSQFHSLQDLRAAINHDDQKPLIFPIPNAKPLTIPVFVADDDVMVQMKSEQGIGPGGAAGPLIQELQAQSQVAETIFKIYWEILACRNLIGSNNTTSEGADLTKLSIRFLHDFGNGLRNLDMFVGQQQPPHPSSMRMIDEGPPQGHPSIAPTWQVQEQFITIPLQDTINLAKFTPIFTDIEISGGESVRVFEMGTCPLPMRALRSLAGFRS